MCCWCYYTCMSRYHVSPAWFMDCQCTLLMMFALYICHVIFETWLRNLHAPLFATHFEHLHMHCLCCYFNVMCHQLDLWIIVDGIYCTHVMLYLCSYDVLSDVYNTVWRILPWASKTHSSLTLFQSSQPQPCINIQVLPQDSTSIFKPSRPKINKSPIPLLMCTRVWFNWHACGCCWRYKIEPCPWSIMKGQNCRAMCSSSERAPGYCWPCRERREEAERQRHLRQRGRRRRTWDVAFEDS